MSEKIEEMNEVDEQNETSEELTETETELEQTETDDDADEVAEEETESESEEEGFEYDEEGNIIIPDDEDEDGDTDEDDGEAAEHETPKPKTETAKTAEDNTNEAPADKSLEDKYSELEAKYKALQSRTKDALKHFGVETEDVDDGLIQVIAESEGVTAEEYRKRISDAEAVRVADLKAIQDVFPHASEYKSITNLPNFARFAQLRMSGATPIEAYRATHSEIISAKSGARSPGGKEHLKGTPPKKTSANAVRISTADLNWMRSEFPGKTDKELIQLYKKTR